MPEKYEPTIQTRVDLSRADLARLADRMLAAARRYASPGHALITLPGAEGGYGRAVDGLEGFARTFLLAGFRIAGDRGAGLDELADWYATGLATGTDPSSPERWTRLDEHGQAKVEAASIALILDLTRPWIWDRLEPQVRERVVDYLSPAVGDHSYPRTNWVWFRLVVQTFLRSVGGSWSGAEMVDDLATHDSFRRAGGWISDGESRAYDHYAGWALHLYPILWARMAGAGDLAVGRRDDDVAYLDRYLRDAITVIGADGSPLIQGRSLTYRFAAAAPFWAGAIAEVPSVPAGALRHAATSIIRHFAERGVPDADGLLSIGWHHPWPRLAQSYSGPGSPYWASKGLLGLMLPADHRVWTEPARPLPIETGDVLRAVAAPGWLISGTRADGIVRVINHGTDHAVEGATTSDSPLYARLGYSTASAPVLDESGWRDPVDQSVVLVDAAGRSSHRSGMRTLAVRIDGAAGVAGSVAHAHWVDPDQGPPDHGKGRTGRVEQAGVLTVFSLVRGPWEVRLVRVEEAAPAAVRLRIGGWAVAGDGPAVIATDRVTVTGSGRTSLVMNVPNNGLPNNGLPNNGVRVENGTPGSTTHDDGGPLGRPVRVPWLDYPATPGIWRIALIGLTSAAPETAAPEAAVHVVAIGGAARIVWPDGVCTRTRLDLSATPATKEEG